jgi:hypothetical protein
MSEAHKGQVPANKGKHVKPEALKRITRINRRIGKAHRKPLKINQKLFEYLLGVIQGDGWATNGIVGIVIGGKDKDYADYLLGMIESATGIKPSLYPENSYYRIFIRSVNFFELIKRYKQNGFWKIPKLQYPQEWIAGIYDTDSSVRRRKNSLEITLHQKRKQNLVHAKLILDSLGIKGKIYKVQTNGMYYLNISNKENSIPFAKLIPLKHPRKARILSQVSRI